MKKSVLLVFMALLAWTALSNDLKKALKAVKKADIEKAVTILHNSIENQPINPGAKWYLAELLSSDSLTFYNIDSARNLIAAALIEYDKISDKEVQSFEKLGFSRPHLVETYDKIKLISLAFAIESKTVKALEQFALWYPGSPGELTALRMRDSLAFVSAKSVNTWQAYLEYFTEYPESIWSVAARKQYDLLFYQDFTSDGKLRTLMEFVSNHPKSAYVNAAIDRIYSFISPFDSKDHWIDFVKTYPEYPKVGKAIDRLYHQNKESFFADMAFLEPVKIDSFIAISNLNDPLIPFWMDQQTGYLNKEGHVEFEPIFNISFDQNHFCEVWTADYMAGEIENKRQIIGRNKIIIYEGEFNEIKDLGNGILFLLNEHNSTLIFKNGEIIAQGISDALLFNNRWIKGLKDGKYGLISSSGDQITDFLFTDISIKGDFWVFEKDGLIAVTNEASIIKEIGEGGFTLEFKFQQIELINDQLIIGFNEDRECMLTSDLRFQIPWGKYEIYPDPYISYARLSNDQFQLFDPKAIALLKGEVFLDIQTSPHWLAVKNEKWKLINLNRQAVETHDSVKLINEFAVMISDNLSHNILFPSSQLIPINDGQNIRNVEFNGLNKSQYLAIGTERTVSLWDSKEKFLFQGIFDDIICLSDSLFRITFKKKQGVIDPEGFYVLEPEYDFIQYKGDILQLLRNNRIGAFDLKHQILLPDNYEGGFVRFQEGYLTTKNRLKGVIDRDNNRVIDFLYLEVMTFSDSASFVRSDSSWQLVSHYDQLTLLDNIDRIIPFFKRNTNVYYKILLNTGYGILNHKAEWVVKPTFTEIKVMYHNQNPVFVAEFFHAESDYYIVNYFNPFGEKIFSNAYLTNTYEMFFCETD